MANISLNAPDMGINFRDPDGLLLGRIFSGEKQFELRRYSYKAPRRGRLPYGYINRKMGIIQTGAGPASLVGFWTLSEPILASGAQIVQSAILSKGIANYGTEFDALPEVEYWIYPITDAYSITPRTVTSRGIVARRIEY